jgi:sulfur relay (sulfurtransferase) DsrF/TusC family protein
MNKKKVVILITSAPHGDVYAYEGIRAAAGLSAGDFDLEVLFIGKGTLNLLKDCENEKSKIYYDLLNDMNVPKSACIDDIEEMGLNLDDMMEGVAFKKRDAVARTCHQADFSINF